VKVAQVPVVYQVPALITQPFWAPPLITLIVPLPESAVPVPDVVVVVLVGGVVVLVGGVVVPVGGVVVVVTVVPLGFGRYLTIYDISK
jgi:hypothetical protein